MISRRSVFVLGAGANVPYGFSTGGGLVHAARGIDPQDLMGNAGLQITAAQSHAFREASRDNLLPSIDAMLEHRPDLMSVGKRVMATLLYRQEAQAGPTAFEQDWMMLLFSNMARGAPTLAEFAQNPVSFVTFNYDRYLEHRFIRGLVSRYRVTRREAWEAIQGMFVHVYGTLGKLPEQVPPGAHQEVAIPLGAPELPNVYTLGLALPVVEQSILIVHDAAASQAAFVPAVQRLKNAQQVLFLGFGFGEQNVQRLQTHTVPPGAAIYATTYGMTRGEIAALVSGQLGTNNPAAIRYEGQPGSESICRYLREFISCLQ